MATWKNAPRPLVLAHRGASAERPENTLPAFERALEVGAGALELDLHFTADHVPIVHHDPSALRITGHDVRIDSQPLSEVRAWDAGAGTQIPTFAEIISAFPGALLNVDTKGATDDNLRRLIALIEQHSATDRVLLAGFQSARLRRLAELGYCGPLGMGRSDVLRRLARPRRLPGIRRAQLPLNLGGARLDSARVIQRLQGSGVAVDFWVVNDPMRARQLVALGADGIITDDPATISNALR
ncbi:MAG: glycerophosphodiester phosphodiesterase family protein [Myxococcota bacterium]|nr:glycerophosphodiester phosphodiesterase family protein [Myxococcota bacterium]